MTTSPRILRLLARRAVPAVTAAACLLGVAGSATAATGGPAAHAAATRSCKDVHFAGVADYFLDRIRATRVGCALARYVIRPARLRQQWRRLGFSCRATGFVPETATFFKCTKGQRRKITFRAI